MSTSAPWTLRNECKCGHHKDTHYEGVHACLGLHCDCSKFRRPGDPEPEAKHTEDKGPDTPRVVGDWSTLFPRFFP